MRNMRKKNLKLTAVVAAALSILVCIAAACGLWARVAEAPITAEANAVSDVVGELYSNTSSSAPFSKDNLNALAKKAGYTDINAMVTAASGGTTKTAADMTTANSGTEWSVTLGSLTWNPMYLSKDSSGNAILTLWQADASVASTWSDGTYSTSASKSWTENGSKYTLYSNSYDGSFVRNYLNGETTYLSNWGSGSNTANKNTAISTTFAAFRSSGNIGDYVVSPSKVSWQMSEANWKNDPSSSKVTNYPKNWTNDKLWLPSIHETYDGTASNTTSLSLRDTSGGTTYGGLWQTSTTQRTFTTAVSGLTNTYKYSWLRSGHYSNYTNAYYLSSSGDNGYNPVYLSGAVRPALHLNLTSAAGAAASSQKTPPADLNLTYDGTSKKVEDMATKPSWYDSAMTFAYDKDGATVTEVTGAGVYTVTATLTDGSTFTTGSSTATFTLTVSPKTVSVTGISASDKTYDGTTSATLSYSAVTYSGIISGDTLSVTATGTFDNKNVGTNKTVNISNITLGGASASNYTLSSTTATTTASITAKSVTVTGITASNKEYDGGTTATLDTTGATFDGIISGDSLSVTATGTFADKNVGTNKTVNITLSALGGTSVGNYILATTGNQSSCTADITAKSVSVTGVSASNKTYDGTTSATLDFTNAAVTGAVQEDGVSVDTTACTGTFDNKNVGANKTVNITGITLTGADAGNYTLSSTTATTTANITAATVTVTGGITANNKTYDGNTTATFVTTGATVTGVKQGDTVTVTATGTFDDKNAGTGKTVTITSLVLGGADASNYALATTGNQSSCTADITPKQLTVTINAGGGVYGGDITAATATLSSGYLSGEQPTVTLTYTRSSPAYNSTAVPTEAGNYTVTASIPAGNYALTGDTSASFVISAGGNSVSVSLTGWTYGETPNTPTATASFGGDTATYAYYSDSACTQSIGAPTSTTPAGTYYVKATIAATGSYDGAEAQTSFTISKKEITVSGITANNKTYDGTTSATLDYSAVVYGGIVQGDTLSVTATGAFDNKNVGTGKTVNITGLTLGGTSVGNYTLATTGQQTTCTADITAKSVSVTGITASNKEYDGGTTATLDTTGATFDGIISGDSLSVTATGAFADKNVGTNKTVNITLSALGGTSASNYTLATTGNQSSCTADITAKSVSVTGVSASDKTYDGTTSATLHFTNAAVYGAVQGDGVSVDTTAGTGTFDNKNVGANKTVNITGITLTGTDAGNYTLATTTATANATITAATVTVTGGITANNKTYDGNTTATFDTTNATFGGIITGDSLSVTATGAFADKNAGTGKTVTISNITLGGADASNYVLATTGNQTSCTADITPKQLTVTINAGGGVYGGNITAATATLGAGYLSGEQPTVTLTYTCSSPAYNSTTVPTEAGTYTVTATIPAGNYALTGDTSASFVISAGGNSVSVSLTGWTYGETPNTPTVTASFGGSTATYAYYSDSACTQSIGAPTSTTPAGTYYVKATIAATGSYDSAEAITSFTISKKEITFSGIAANNKTYDGNTAATLNYSAVVYGGIVAGDDLSVTATGTFADKNVGTGKTVNITGLTLGGTSVGNYILATTGQQTSCTADITAAEITVTGITASGKTYDGTTSADLNYSAVTYTGIVAGDSLSVTATGAFDNKNVGTGKTVNITNITLSGTSVGNYILATTGNQTTCTADITAAEITISGIAANGKDYDGNTAASLDYSAVVYGGIAAGDSLSVTATGTYETASAGYGKTVNITSLVLGGADASNYVLAPTGQQTSCTADVIGKEVTVTGIAAESRQYDGTTEVTFDYSAVRIEGVTAGDEVSVVAVGAFESADVGADITVNITSLTLVGADSANYMLAATGNQTSCTADITRREITVTVTADDHDAEEVQAATATLNNVVADEEVKYTLAYTGTIANGTPYSSAEAPTEKGEYKVTISIDESVYTNYVLTGAVEKTFIITQTVSDENGNEVDIPIDGDFDFVVTQTPTNDNYDYEGISIGYSARLWVLAEDGTASAEYRESVRCNIIFKVPETIADEILRSGKTLPETQADGDLLLYAATDGESLSIDEYKLYFDMSGTMYVRFSYEGSFPAEIIFNAPNVVKETQKSSGIPWWVWLIVALAAIAVIGVVVVIIVVVKKKNGDSAATTTTTTVVQGEKFDDSDIQRRLTDLENRDDGGFMDPYDGE